MAATATSPASTAARPTTARPVSPVTASPSAARTTTDGGGNRSDRVGTPLHHSDLADRPNRTAAASRCRPHRLYRRRCRFAFRPRRRRSWASSRISAASSLRSAFASSARPRIIVRRRPLSRPAAIFTRPIVRRDAFLTRSVLPMANLSCRAPDWRTRELTSAKLRLRTSHPRLVRPPPVGDACPARQAFGQRESGSPPSSLVPVLPAARGDRRWRGFRQPRERPQ